MAMRVPVSGGLPDCFDDLVDVLKAPPFQGQAAQLLPPRLDQDSASTHAYLGINRRCTSGQAISAVCFSRDTWVVRLSVISTHSRAGYVCSTCARSWMKLALSRRGLHNVVAGPVAGSNAPKTHTLPRRP